VSSGYRGAVPSLDHPVWSPVSQTLALVYRRGSVGVLNGLPQKVPDVV